MPDNETPNNPWLKRIPELEGGRRFPSLAPDKATQLFGELLSADKKEIVSIIDALNEIDDGKDWKARFVLGALASHVGAADRKNDRAKLESILAGAVQQADRPASVKTFLVMQLHWFAGAAAAPAIASQLGDQSPGLVDAAVAALAAIGDPGAQALKEAQGKAKGHARVAIDHALR